MNVIYDYDMYNDYELALRYNSTLKRQLYIKLSLKHKYHSLCNRTAVPIFLRRSDP